MIHKTSPAIRYTLSSFTYSSYGTFDLEMNVDKVGEYTYEIKVNADGIFSTIKDSPFKVYFHPSYPEPTKSSASGSGVTKAILGRKEIINIFVKDEFGNNYNSSTLNS